MNKNFLIIISAVLLFVCSSNLHLEYGIYQILRWLVTITAAVFAYDNFGKSQWKFIICCIIAILFNPLFPVYLKKSSWVSIDICSAILLLAVGFIKNNNKKE